MAATACRVARRGRHGHDLPRPATPSSTATWRSSCCAPSTAATRRSSPASARRRSRPPRSTIPTWSTSTTTARRRRPVHRHGVGRRRRPRGGPARARPAPIRRPRRASRSRSPTRWPQRTRGHRPPRHQADQHPAHARRPVKVARLRHRARLLRGTADVARHDPRQRPLLQPGAGARRDGDDRLGRLLAGPGALRDAHRQTGWTGDSAGAVAVARLAGDPPPPSSINPEVPHALDTIVRAALARNPSDRPTAGQLSAALNKFIADPNAPIVFGPQPTLSTVPLAAGAAAAAAATYQGPAYGTYAGSYVSRRPPPRPMAQRAPDEPKRKRAAADRGSGWPQFSACSCWSPAAC